MVKVWQAVAGPVAWRLGHATADQVRRIFRKQGNAGSSRSGDESLAGSIAARLICKSGQAHNQRSLEYRIPGFIGPVIGYQHSGQIGDGAGASIPAGAMDLSGYHLDRDG
nr:hypothetical protein [Rhizobium vallis]